MKKDKLFFQIMKKIFLGHHKELRILILCETILTATSWIWNEEYTGYCKKV